MDRRRVLFLATSLAVMVLVVVAVASRSDGGAGTQIAVGSDDTTTTTTTTVTAPPPTTTTTRPATTTTSPPATAKVKSSEVASGRGWTVRRTESATGEQCLEVQVTTVERACGITRPDRVVGVIGVFTTPGGEVLVAVTDTSVTGVDRTGGGPLGWGVGNFAADPFLPDVKILTYADNGSSTRSTVIFRSGDDPVAMAEFVAGRLAPPGFLYDSRPTYGKRTGYRKLFTGLSWGIHEFGVYDGADGAPCLLFRRLVPLAEDEEPATTGDACIPKTGRRPIEAAQVLPTSKPGFVDVFAAFTADIDGWKYAVPGKQGYADMIMADPRDPSIHVPFFHGSVVVPETAETMTIIATNHGTEVARVDVPIPKPSSG
ncbi:MAG: hypothetical protein QOF60_1723 [Actinomycetota bacterium]|nr:hypothetical protein [Actinomycetota bacterium]